MYADGKGYRPDQDRPGIGAYCPFGSMVRETCDCIIGDAPLGAIPFHRLFDISVSPRRHRYLAGAEAMMSSGKKPEGLSQLNLKAAGIDVGATSHYVAVSPDRAEQPVRESPPSRRTCTVWRTGWGSVAWRPW